VFSFSPNEPLIKLERRQLKNNGEFINVFVSLVSSPLSFIIQLQDDLKNLNGLLSDLESHCNIRGKLSSLTDIQKGECYAVFDDDSQKWVRYVFFAIFVKVCVFFVIHILVNIFLFGILLL